ncbi:MAG: hypothetical protein EOP10_07510 [Proteobacteria bacterium]|nr:MAG: hypothetical protein EOP10_07510 [Pseudomonadota bacterium]
MRMLMIIISLLLSDIVLAGSNPLNPCAVVGNGAHRSENLMGALTQWPTPAFMVLEQAGAARFVAPSKVYADVLEIHEKSLIINHLEELRFLSQTLAHSEILLVLKEASDLDDVKVKKVLSVAKLLDISLSLVWLNDKPSSKALKDLVAQSGGRSFDTRDLLKRTGELCVETLAGR